MTGYDKVCLVDRNNNKQNNNKVKNMKRNIKRNGPGRPAYTPVIPKGKFTMNDLCEANGVSLKTGKGKLCSKLTLVKWLAKQLANRRSGLVTKTDATAEPNSKDGLGRKSFVYIRRPGMSAKTLKTATKSTVSVKLAPQTTADYEATKAALLAPSPAPVTPTEPVTAPVAEVAPAAEPAPAAAPEVTAPVAATDPVTA